MKVATFFLSPVKGVGLFIPISLPFEIVDVVIVEVGWMGFRKVEKGWKGDGCS